ncbi:MAG: copper amine oxidase N-terminal domain-containing protein [Lachnospirales bacterium]
MKKKLLATLALTASMAVSAFAGTAVTINGQAVENAQAIVENGATYIAVRPIADALGLNVEWKADTKTVVVTNGGPLYITFKIGVNGYTFAKTAPMELSGAPIVVDSTTYVPADVFTDLFEYTVTNENGTVNIVTEDKESAVGFGTVTEVSADEILFNDEIKGDVRLSKGDSVKVTDENGNDVDINSITVGTKLTVEYGDAETMSLPPLNNPVSIIVHK